MRPYHVHMPEPGVAQRVDAILARRAREAPPLETTLLRGLAVYRWAALVWLVVVLTVSRDEVERFWLAAMLTLLAVAVTAYSTWAAWRSPGTLLRLPFVLTEQAVIAALAIGGGFVFVAGQETNTNALASQWALAGVLQAGAAFGFWAGAGSGFALSLWRLIGTAINREGVLEADEWLSALSTTVTFVLAGGLVGGVVDLLRRSERQVALAEAREEVARTLHDGVLQTLAVIERRADDDALARMARDQELELREFLFGTGATSESGGAREIGPDLRAAAKRYEERFDGRVEVVLAPDLPELTGSAAEALAGAVGEALTNAGKHASPSRVTVFVEPADTGGVNASVLDDGCGFDPTTVVERVGLAQSIRGRITEAGGRVEIDSRPGRGTEVRMWLP